jgi:hypothetical protein
MYDHKDIILAVDYHAENTDPPRHDIQPTAARTSLYDSTGGIITGTNAHRHEC